MILEAAILTVRPEQDEAFAAALAEARPLIAATPGFQGLEIRPCIEQPHRYLLLVWWERLTDHTERFRQSERYQEWKARLHHFYDPFPTVEHFGPSIV
jgi:heme-degrading monooxygenase HmoA